MSLTIVLHIYVFMKEISRFDVMSLGKMQGVLMGLIGAVFGIIANLINNGNILVAFWRY